MVFVCFADAEERGADGDMSLLSEDEREAMGLALTASAAAVAAATGRKASEGRPAWSDLDCRNPMFHAANANAEKAVARSVVFTNQCIRGILCVEYTISYHTPGTW